MHGDHRDLHVLTHSCPSRRASDRSAGTGSGAATCARFRRCRPAWSRVRTSILLVARCLLAGVDPPRQCIELPEARGVLAPLAVLHERGAGRILRSEEHTSELQSLMRISYAVFCLKKKKNN